MDTTETPDVIVPTAEVPAVPIPVVEELVWPSVQDLNTRLRRVITSYQRNYKKEELKQQQKAKVSSCRVCLRMNFTAMKTRKRTSILLDIYIF